MAIIIDIILIAVVLLFALIGMKRGFIKEIISLVGVVAAFIAALLISDIGSSFIYDSFVDKSVRDTVSESVLAQVENDTDSIVSSIPQKYLDAADTFGIDIENVVNENIGDTAQDTAASVSEAVSLKIARPMLIPIIRVILFLILFIVIKLIIDLIGRALNIVARLPVIQGANKILGFVIGVLRGVIAAVIICYAFNLVLRYHPDGFLKIDRSTAEASYIFKWISGFLKI